MEREREHKKGGDRDESKRGRWMLEGGKGGGGRGGDLSFIPVILLEKKRFLIWL